MHAGRLHQRCGEILRVALTLVAILHAGYLERLRIVSLRQGLGGLKINVRNRKLDTFSFFTFDQWQKEH